MAAADQDESGTKGAGGGSAGGSRRKLILASAGALLGIGVVGGGAWFFLKGHKGGDGARPPTRKQVAFVELKEMLVNLSQAQGTDQKTFLKLKIALELADPKVIPEIQPLLPRVEDAFQVYVRELRPSELDGSAAVLRLKEELLKRVNMAVYPAKVEAVLFKEILMQ